MAAAEAASEEAGAARRQTHMEEYHRHYRQLLTGSLSLLFSATADTTYKPRKPQQECSVHPPLPFTMRLQDFSSGIRTV